MGVKYTKYYYFSQCEISKSPVTDIWFGNARPSPSDVNKPIIVVYGDLGSVYRSKIPLNVPKLAKMGVKYTIYHYFSQCEITKRPDLHIWFGYARPCPSAIK